MKCSVCGRENIGGARFCETCGSPLPKSSVTVAVEADNEYDVGEIKTKYTKDALLKHAPIVFFVIQIFCFFSTMLMLMDWSINQGIGHYFEFFADSFNVFNFGYLALGVLIFVFMKKRKLVGVLVMSIVNLFIYIPLWLIYMRDVLSELDSGFLGKLISEYYLANIIPAFVNILVIVFTVLVMKNSDKPWMKYRKAYAVIPAAILLICRLCEILTNPSGNIGSIFAFFPEFLEVIGVFVLTYWIAGHNTVTTFYAPWYSRPKKMYGHEYMSSYVCRLRDRVIISARFGTFLAAVILVTLSLFVQLAAINDGLRIFRALDGLSELLDFDALKYLGYTIELVLETSEIEIAPLKFLMLIPTVLTVIGLWLIYGSARTRSYDLSVAVVGCKMVKVVEIVVCVIKSLFFAAIWFKALDLSSNGYFSDSIERYCGIAALVAVLVIILCIVKCVAICKALDTAIDAAKEEYVRDQSRFIVVVCVINGIVGALMSGFDFVGILNGTASILFAMTASLFLNSVVINDLSDEDYI